MTTGISSGRDASLLESAVAVVLAVGFFLCALAISWAVSEVASAILAGEAVGRVTGLVLGIAALQVIGFGSVLGAYLWHRDRKWRSYLRLGEFTTWTLFYGSAVGLGLMLVAVGTTVLFTFLGIEPAQSQAGTATEPSFYVVLFLLSTFVGVPMEELFFRGLLQRRLEESVHPVLAIGLVSLLFMSIHANVRVGSGGEMLALGLFFTFGVVLGTSYYVTENLFVPIVGHVIYNGVQILLRGLEVAL